MGGATAVRHFQVITSGFHDLPNLENVLAWGLDIISMTSIPHLFASVPSPIAAQGAVIVSAGNEEEDNLEALLERFLISIIALAGAQAGTVQVLTEDGKCMRLVAQQGLPTQLLTTERLIERDCSMCGMSAEHDVLGWVDDLRSCVRHSAQAYVGLQCKRVLAISLQHDGQVLGIYNLFFNAQTEVDPQTQTMLRLVAQLLGLALHDARVERERLHMTVMKERQEMVSEVHDAIAQTLAYVKMRLPLLSDAMLSHDDTRALKYFSDVKMAVGEVHDNLREVMTYFRTRMDPLGLVHALQGIADGFFDRTGIALALRNSVPNLNLTDQQEIQVFHIVREALANIAKYSMAQSAVVAISRLPQGLEFLVVDDGLGIEATDESGTVSMAKGLVSTTHFGLEIMQNRAQRLGGSLDLGRNDSGGTRVRLLLPRSTAQEDRLT